MVAYFRLHHIRRDIMSLCPIIGDVLSNSMVKMLFAICLLQRYAFPLVINK